MGRLIKWFVAQDEAVQASALGLLSESAVAVLAAKELERKGRPGRRGTGRSEAGHFLKEAGVRAGRTRKGAGPRA